MKYKGIPMKEQKLLLEEKKDFSREIKLKALKLKEESDETATNLFVPLVLFNRKETLELLKKVRDRTDELRGLL